ncbi:type IV pilus twitching motility protein PilT [Deinococcus petrolearius]|uniref:Type IV pilus twitching motility protein PilT n=1 Tax=Deinococcus petrolearius TaxID=1751295 RepID=A0ABW1DMK0_9DEIO
MPSSLQPAQPPFTPTLEDVSQVLELAVSNKASDIIFKHGNHPKVKVNGAWESVEDLPKLKISEMDELVNLIMGEQNAKKFRKEQEYDFQFSTENLRFRVNAAYQSGGPFMTFRPIPKNPPILDDLTFIDEEKIIPLLKRLVEMPRGLVLVTGPTGMGKSTTLAALVRHINENFAKNIITIEDPVEFQHEDLKSIISQREVHNDTESFARALRGVLRQTPDIILVGELRDPETIEAALTAAETGHLVLGTLHTNSAPQAISRILDVTSEGKVNLIKTQLAASLRAVITQQLVPKQDGAGKQVILEVMLNEGPIQTLIKDGSGELNKYYDQMTTNTSESVLMDEQLARAARMKIISPESAMSRAIQPDRYETLYQNIQVAPGLPRGVRKGTTSIPATAPETPPSTPSGWGRKN